jgi:outer membrane lipoprotein SlyB
MMMKIRLTTAGSLLAALTILSGCAYQAGSPDTYYGAQTGQEQSVRFAVVESVRAVRIDASNGRPTGLGAVGGGVVGAVAGSAIGGGSGSIVTGVVGGIAGALAGNAIENRAAIRDGLELTVRLDNGDMRAITQEATGEVFQAGDRVRLLSSDGLTRVTH